MSVVAPFGGCYDGDMVDMDALGCEGIRPLERAEYDRLVELGCFEDERLELLRGFLVAMSPQKTGHAFAIQALTMLLVPALADRGVARVQLPLAVADDSEPEPDFAVVPPGDYRDEHPRTALLVVEVAHASLPKDRRIKTAIYAEAGIPEYWIVNIEDRVVEVHRDSDGETYARWFAAGADETLTPLALPDVTIRVSELLA